MFIYLDESGDLGLELTKAKTTNYFVVTILIIENQKTRTQFFKAAEKTIKNKINHRKKPARSQAELKGVRTPITVKRYFLRNLPISGWSIHSLILDKKYLSTTSLQPREQKVKFYDHLIGVLLKQIAFAKREEIVNLILDKCRNGKEIKECDFYLEQNIKPLINAHHLKITHENSESNFGLQAVDLFCWGIARKHNNNDTEWYDEFKKRIQFEEVYLPD